MSVIDGVRLIFSNVNDEWFDAALEGPNFSGCVTASMYHVGPPCLLFDEMARDWLGWERSKEWETLEGDLRITAKSDDTGHIALVVSMRNYSSPTDWRLQATLELEAGQLEELARTVGSMFRAAL